ncbi:MAG: HEAT repeat domain-containing protein [Archaeoglobus sp.]|nr:HEAT repeat domain-containing protein [Archaeoglobus sp.]
MRKRKVEAAKQIAEFGEKAVKLLVPILKEGKNDVREGAIIALAEIGKRNPRALDPLLEDEDENVRAGAVFALFLAGEVEKVIESLKDESALVRVTAKNALSLSDSIDKLIKALENEDWRVRYGVSAALEESGERAVKPLLRVLVEGNKQMELAKSILLRIAQRDPENFIDALDDPELRIPAMEILLESGLKREFLSELIEHKSKRVREAGIVLISFNPDERILEKALKDESWFVRMVAAETLAKRFGSKYHKRLKKLLNDVEIVRETVNEFLE